MAVVTDPSVFKDSLVLLTVAGIAVPLMHKLKINAILSFLLLGAVLGPYGLGAFVAQYPQLDYIAVKRSEGLSLLGDLGVVFLLFLIGMELSIQRLITMRRLVFGLGSLQMVLCSLAIAGGATFMGWPVTASIFIGMAMALSSTAIVIQVLARQKQLNSSTGRATFSILLFQDLAVIPLLFVLSIWGEKAEQNLFSGLTLALGQAALIVAIIYAAGRVIIRPLFRLVASTESADLFVATTLLAVIGSAVASSSAGASMALGAFVAGLLIAETEYSRAISAVVEPFKGLLLGLFFFTVGMVIDMGYILKNPMLVTLCVAALIAIKAVLTLPIIKLFGFSWPASVKTSLLLGPAGEFAFVIIGLASASGILKPAHSALAISVASLTMTITPLMGKLGVLFTNYYKKTAPPLQKPPATNEVENVEALIIGLRRVGSMACEMLTQHNVRYIAIDLDPTLVEGLRDKGFPAYYGNGADPLFLNQCGIMTAKSVIITSHARQEIDDVVKTVRALNKDIQIVTRAHDAEHAMHLYEQGVTVAVPETIEASLQLSEAALFSLQRNEKDIIDSINKKREGIRAELQQSAALHHT